MNPNRRASSPCSSSPTWPSSAIAFVVAMATAARARPWPAGGTCSRCACPVRNLFALLAYLALWHCVLRSAGLYGRIDCRRRRASCATSPWRSASRSCRWSYSCPLERSQSMSNRRSSWLFAPAAFVGLAIERRMLRAVGRRLRLAGRNLRNVVVVGTGERGARTRPRASPAATTSATASSTSSTAGRAAAQQPAADGAAAGRSAARRVRSTRCSWRCRSTARSRSSGRIVTLCEEQGITVRVGAQLAALDWARAPRSTRSAGSRHHDLSGPPRHAAPAGRSA